MPAKSSKSPKIKPDWLLCNQSGILYHSSSSEAHSAWLSSSSDGISRPAPHPHISCSRLHTSSPTCLPQSSLNPALSPRLAFSSVFVSPGVARVCGLGQASLVKILSGDSELVVTVFTSSHCPPTAISCSRHSWLASLPSSTSQFSTLESFSHPVEMARSVSVSVESEDEEDLQTDETFLSAVRFHLAGLVISNTARVPFSYYGVNINLRVTVETDVASMLDRLDINTPTMVTSTPTKASGEPEQKEYFRISSSTKCNLVRKKTNTMEEKPRFVGGLDSELETILSAVQHEFSDSTKRKMMTGLLLYGPSGTGKTLLAESLPLRLGVPMVRIVGPEIFSKFYGETEKKLREKFRQAESLSPCLLLLDELDSLAAKREPGAGSEQERRLVAALLALLDSLHSTNSRVVVVAATNRLDSVEPSLRRPGRFDMELEIGVPGVKERRHILSGKLEERNCDSLAAADIDQIAGDTHGYVGADMEALVSLALLSAKEGDSSPSLEHFQRARASVKPSAMREVMVEVPRVTWDDIGGLEDLKLKLRQAVEWPIKHPEVFTRMGISTPKGLLMFGPPGCSKTMIAKALANESGLNFLSIKGPELFSKWVGESERAVREIFKKARQVRPSILFFDEIDAVGGARGDGGGKVGDRVLAQLLTEMDGVEGLAGVTVVAATNRPDMMDQALLRPGRLDRVVLVPLPDLDTRRKVLTVHTRNKPLSAEVDLETVALRTEGYSGAEIAAVCNEAALAALEENVAASEVNQKHFETALNSLKPRISKDLFAIYDKFQSEQRNKTV